MTITDVLRKLKNNQIELDMFYDDNLESFRFDMESKDGLKSQKYVHVSVLTFINSDACICGTLSAMCEEVLQYGHKTN